MRLQREGRRQALTADVLLHVEHVDHVDRAPWATWRDVMRAPARADALYAHALCRRGFDALRMHAAASSRQRCAVLPILLANGPLDTCMPDNSVLEVHVNESNVDVCQIIVEYWPRAPRHSVSDSMESASCVVIFTLGYTH